MPLALRENNNPNPLETLHHYLQNELKEVDKIIERHLESSVPLIPALARHLIYAGGKRLRPLLTLASYGLFKKEGLDPQQDIVGLAAAVEFIHTATLLHDDVIDESKLRRGQSTANELWGNQASVLVGDFLFARSFQLMIGANNSQVLKILANASACISEGEVLQLSLCHTLEATIEESLHIIEAKTATLFAAACEGGALLATHEEHATALRAYGKNLGMAFQIVDDILDYGESSASLGKEVGDDFREGKITLPLILTYSQCQPSEKEFFKRTLIDQHQTPSDFSYALEILHKYKGHEKAYNLAKSYGEKAGQALAPLPSHPLKDILFNLVNYCFQRQG